MPEKSIFDDMPEEEMGAESETEEGKGQEDRRDKDKADAPAPSEEELRQLKIANKVESKKLAKLKEELDKKRAERKKLQKEIEEEGEEGEEKEPEDKTKALVEEAFKRKQEEDRQLRLADKIRKIAKTRGEAEAYLAETLKMPTTGDDDLDVDFGVKRAQAIRSRSAGFNSPSVAGGGFTPGSESPRDEIEGFSKERLDWLEAQGVKREDVKALKDGGDWSRIFPRVAANKRSR